MFVSIQLVCYKILNFLKGKLQEGEEKKKKEKTKLNNFKRGEEKVLKLVFESKEKGKV